MWSFSHRRNKAQAPQEDPRDSSEHKTAACHDYSPLHLDIRATGICINDKPLKTLNVSSLAEIFGPARLVSSTGASGDFERKGYESLAMWDEVGIFAFTVDGEDTTELGVRLAEDPVGEAAMYFDFASRRPSQLFPGSLTFEGRSPLSSIPQADLRTAYISLDTHAGEWTATFFLNATECGDLRTLNLVQRKAKAATDELTDYVRAAAHRFAWVSITYNAPRSDNRPSLERAPTGRWKHPVSDEPLLEFLSLPFRLAVIQELMYEQDLLKPRFDVYDFAADQGDQSFNPEDTGLECIPSVLEWFRTLPIPARLAERVEEIVFDGGNEIYLQLIPQWDGEDGAFHMESLSESDIVALPQLKKVQDLGGFLGLQARTALIRCGVEVI
ncbi:DUF6892 domain-containing protein [Corynebacterium flavescens]|uniref:DUF6892 domain-containing protein n=1 Tax=Corynebacterium flavescens TaxID=28028 RepID=UPI00289DD356|nr:hypothetical protein [Corynebacterium flavescens]